MQHWFLDTWQACVLKQSLKNKKRFLIYDVVCYNNTIADNVIFLWRVMCGRKEGENTDTPANKGIYVINDFNHCSFGWYLCV